MVIQIAGFKLEEQLLTGDGAVLQVGHDGGPALVLEVFVVHQAFAEGAEFVGNFKHFLEGRNQNSDIGVSEPEGASGDQAKHRDETAARSPEQVVFARQRCERRLASGGTPPP